MKKISEEAFANNDDFFDRLVEDMNQAIVSIDLETYIFSEDSIGIRIAKTLAQASRRGVKVRVLVDGIGSYNWGGEPDVILKEANVAVHIYHPLPWKRWHWLEVAPSMIGRFFFYLTRMNRRNHRKMCLIDNKIVWVGSSNISLCHCSRVKGGEGWRDTVLRLTDYSVSIRLKKAFNIAWKHQHFVNFYTRFRSIDPIRLNNSRWRRAALYRDLRRRIKRAKKRIWITNAYFIPEYRLLRRLKKATRRKIDVRLLLPSQSDITFMTWTMKVFYEELLKAGVKIYEYSPNVLHAKVIIIDDWAIIGSSNLNHRSLFHDLELDIAIRTTIALKSLEKHFSDDIKNSTLISLKERETYLPLWQIILGRFFLLIRSIL